MYTIAIIVGIFVLGTAVNATFLPSPDDDEFDTAHGVPDLIVSDQGVFANGPEFRRGGLSGPPGFPL
jgi:hypothetical protein